MEEFKPTKIDLSQINGGKGRYNDGDGVHADSINSAIEASAWAQSLGTTPPDVSNAGKVGTPNVSIDILPDGTPRFKFDNLKGDAGTGATVVQKAGIDTENVMSQKAVTENLYFSGEETSLTWYRKSYTIYTDGSIYGDGYLDSTIRLANVNSHLVQGPDITNKMVTISVDSGYKYACVLYKDVSNVKFITSKSDWKYYTEPTTWFANGEYKYLLIALGKIDDSEILTTESSAIHIETFDSVKGQVTNSVKYTTQSLTTGQKKLARDNIMAMPGKMLGNYENKVVSFLKTDGFHLISNDSTNIELFIGETSKFSKTSVMFLSFSLSNWIIYLSGITANNEVFHYNYVFQSADTGGWIKFTAGYGIVDIFGNTEVTLTNG